MPAAASKGMRGETRREPRIGDGLKIHLHIGAHKTATTFVQTRLEGHKRLAALGVAVAPHARVRTEIADRLDGSSLTRFVGRSVASGVKGVLADYEQARLLVISDENLAGPMASLESPDGMYPALGSRLDTLLDSLDGHDVTVFLSVRDYAAFFSSAYAFRAEQRKAASPEIYRDRAANLVRSWAHLAADAAAQIGAERVVVWTYERLCEASSAISDAITDIEGLDLFPPTARPRLASLTRKGAAVVDRVSDLLSEDERARFARHVARFAFDAPDERVSVVDEALAGWLTGCYREDLAAIEAMGCRLLGHRV